LAEGDYGFEIRFRQRDFLEDVPGPFNHLVATLPPREEEDLAALGRLERSLTEPSTARRLLAELLH